MKRFALLTGILALAAPLAIAQASTWQADSAHSEVDFTIRHMSVSNVHGRLGKVTATINYNEADIAKSTVQATIDVTGIDTSDAARDKHLKSPDFFDVPKFPTATFVSTSVIKDGAGLKIAGNLTLHGITKPVVLAVDGPSTPIVSPMDQKLHSGFTATTTLSRTEFGIGTKYPEPILGNAVKLVIELEVVKQ